MELKVYSTVAGELPLMVSKGSPECFIPYDQGLALTEEIATLKKQMAQMELRHIQELDERGLKSYNSGYAVAKQHVELMGVFRVDNVVEVATKLQGEVNKLLALVSEVKSSK